MLDVRCSKKIFPFPFSSSKFTTTRICERDSTVFSRRVPFNRKWFIQGKIVHTVCDPILRPNWRFLLLCYSFYFAFHCFLFFLFLFFSIYVSSFTTTREIFSLSLSLNLKFFSLLFYAVGIVARRKKTGFNI